MRANIIVGLLLVLSTAACVGTAGQGSGIPAVFKVDIIRGGTEDITIQAEIPEFARPDREFDWQIEATPAQEISKLSVNVFDRSSCTFTNSTPDSWYAETIKSNRTTVFKTNYVVGKVDFEKDCIIGFKATYSSNSSAGSTVAVLQENDYMEMERTGKLGEIPISSWNSVSPLEIGIRGLDQPLIDNQRADIHIDYSNTGKGNIEALEPGSVIINLPGNLASPDCDDYSQTAEGLVLKRRLEFIDKVAKSSSCTFVAKAWLPIDSRPLGISAAYVYQLQQQVTIKVRPV